MHPPSPGSVEALLDENDKSSNRRFYRKSGKTFDRLSRRRLFTICASLAIVSLLCLVVFHLRAPQPTSRPTVDLPTNVTIPSEPASKPVKIDPLDPSRYLRGPPAQKFRDNLLIEHNYITSWISAGWTNDVITYANLVYLAQITDRIPVISVFNPSHIGGHVSPIPFGEVFDVPRLRRSLGRPVLEWREVKDPQHRDVEILGCWNTWESVQTNDHNARSSIVTHQLGLDISYTQTPGWIKLVPNFEHDQHSTFWSLASLAFPETRKANLVPPRPSPERNVSLPPDEHLVCYDYLYYVGTNQPAEYELDFSPAWRYAGQYFRWTSRLEHLGDQFVRRTMGIRDNDEEPTPPWITVHVRHRDFAGWCRGVPVEDCFASLPVIARRVQEVKDELLERKGIKVNHVIMTSDETNDTWWQGVADQGWLKVDHSKTVELYGGWYPLLIDAVIQSNGIGFVANDLSTVSVAARRRVESWHNGITRTVRWGTPDADDH